MKPELAARLEEVLAALRERGRSLIAAVAAHAEARLAYEAALDALEDARARAIREGLEGRNEQARQAELLERTREQEEAARSARAVLRVAEANLEMARVAWAVEKETLKALASLAEEALPEVRPRG
ncbi:hypothetical protein TCCBUS3UF1_p20 (plasmid) [Thermus sp. CCB_US3_UF1]|uniref:hypothetical protein n=1 Tax=Thermus sp. CCB_US3_UF1 TaxID=1111069 RepID=UPI00023893EF|nr:hypothetical protein [Thermus sp. CCB_US3_UF1]AEV17299.1 hypothetical protein TCCBUS3UF1_p20 [Thermus sp. CCB_US3_UF1]